MQSDDFHQNGSENVVKILEIQLHVWEYKTLLNGVN